MKKTYLQRGFTLIELLVVIAIIGILSSVVLASLNTARNKGADTAVKSNMASIRTQAELWYTDNGSKYNTTVGTALTSCAGGIFGDPVISNAISQITAQSVAPVCNTTADGQKWAISVSALKGAATTWCVDNSGWAKIGTAAAGVCS